MRLTPRVRAAATLAFATLLVAATESSIVVTGAGGGLETGKPLRITVRTAARSEAGNEAQPPLAWIDHAETLTPEAANCAARAARLGEAGALQPAARDFNSLHIAMVDAKGHLHVLDPRNGIQGARSLAHVDLGEAPASVHWSQTDGLIWAALPRSGRIVAIDIARWTISRSVERAGPVSSLRAGIDGTLYAVAPGTGVYRIDARAAVLIPGTTDATSVMPMGDGAFWLIGPDRIRLIANGKDRPIDLVMREAHWSARADRLVALTGDGDLVTITRSGTIIPLRGMPGAQFANPRLWLSPDGGAAIVYDRRASVIHAVSLETGAFTRSFEVDRPVSFAASDSFVFVRSEGRGETFVLPLAELGRSEGGGPRWIAGGEPVSPTRPSAALTATSAGLSAWVDAERNLIYLYHEGMNIPSGTLRNPGAQPEHLLLVGPSMRATAAGRFEAGFRLDRPGQYVAVVSSLQPRFTECAAFTVRGEAKVPPGEHATLVQIASSAPQGRVGERITIRLQLAAQQPMPDRIGILVMNASGVGPQWRLPALARGGGTFEATVPLQRPGALLVMPDPVTVPGRVAGRPVQTITVME